MICLIGVHPRSSAADNFVFSAADERQETPMISLLPSVNATLNAAAAVLLVRGLHAHSPRRYFWSAIFYRLQVGSVRYQTACETKNHDLPYRCSSAFIGGR
jgi:hypothetical protein